MIPLEDEFNRIYDMDLHEINHKFKYIGEGSSRAVYALDNRLVIKVATCKSGYSQCKLENHIFNDVSDNLKDYLCPIIWYRPGMIVMPRAYPLTNVMNREDDVNLSKIGRGKQGYKDLRYLSKKYNLLFDDIIAPSSWGFLDGKLVLIDYGCKN
ncbi:MAG: hypothetical protein Q8936_04845 [Bacillota bacterium]|nr:hypothetical protein [Bacillota bacterium]